MCGIAGIYRPAAGPDLNDELDSMVGRIEHRGPDGRGSFVDGPIGLAHVRLAILDLTDSAAQPMQSQDRRYVLSFNGEIYNYRELRRELQDRGIEFRSTGDTQVLIEYIAAFGIERTLPRLEGDWAIAVWDSRERLLTLGRDRYGVKPLYYRLDAGTEVRFGSEIKALTGRASAPEPALMSAALLGLSTTWVGAPSSATSTPSSPGSSSPSDRICSRAAPAISPSPTWSRPTCSGSWTDPPKPRSWNG